MPIMADMIASVVRITGDTAKLAEAAKAGKLFDYIVPEPDWANIPNEAGELPTNLHWADGTQDVRFYNWRILNWGTKWEADVTQIEYDGDTLVLSIETAWAPTPPIYDALIAAGLEVDWEWEDWEVEEDQAPIWRDISDVVYVPFDLSA
jgi:hypothetical protein